MRLKKQYYMTRGDAGEEHRYTSPDELLKKGYAYFEWCVDNPWTKSELLKSGDKKGEAVGVPLGRPFTMQGLYVFCGISQKTFGELENDIAFASVAEHLRSIVFQHQLEGASIGIYNANLVARMQGLTDRQELTTADGAIVTINTTGDETKDDVVRLKQKLQD